MESTHNEGVAVGRRISRMSHGVGFGTMLAISCLISYWLITTILAREYSVSHDNDLLGGMWAVVTEIGEVISILLPVREGSPPVKQEARL